MNKILGRTDEQEILRKRINSDSAELIALYGRRRVGKTYLIKQFFNNDFNFYFTGIFQGSKKEQLEEFARQLSRYSGVQHKKILSWFDAFALLREYLETLPLGKPIVVFLDELPWMDTPKSRFIAAFGKKERGTLYQLTDLFSLFYLRYVKDYKGQDEHHWQNMLDSPSRRAWSGYAFEQLCLHHIRQIKSKLGISGVQSDIYSWKD